MPCCQSSYLHWYMVFITLYWGHMRDKMILSKSESKIPSHLKISILTLCSPDSSFSLWARREIWKEVVNRLFKGHCNPKRTLYCIWTLIITCIFTCRIELSYKEFLSSLLMTPKYTCHGQIKLHSSSAYYSLLLSFINKSVSVPRNFMTWLNLTC